MDVSDARQLKGLETGIARPERLLADSLLDNSILKRGLTQPPDPGHSLVESVRLSFLFGFWVQGPVSGAYA
mgnify:CR=1 FL=1